VCVCLLLDTFYQCLAMSVVFVTSILLATWTATLLRMKMFCCDWVFFVGDGHGVGGRSVLDGLICM
jgi:hypothetical protein